VWQIPSGHARLRRRNGSRDYDRPAPQWRRNIVRDSNDYPFVERRTRVCLGRVGGAPAALSAAVAATAC